MANRPPRAAGGFPPSNMPRQNEYFLPRDGIDREVITADICRYLGNDALVRPGMHTQDDGHTIQGYFITAYRNLTSAMITDLKADSARWEAERRRHQSGAGTPDSSFRDWAHNRVQNPNSPPVRYTDSQTRDGQQRGMGGGGGGGGVSPGVGGPGASYGMQQPPYGSNRDPRDYEANPRYPGSEAPGYSASGPGGPNMYGAPGAAMGGGYGNAAPAYPRGMNQQGQYGAQQPPTQDAAMYGGPPPPAMGGMPGGFGAGNNGGMAPPINQEGYTSGANYTVAPSRDNYSSMDIDVPMARRNTPPGGAAAFGNPNNVRGYGGGPGNPPGGYGGYAQPPPNMSAFAQPIDNGYGRAPVAANSGYDMPQQQQQVQQQYDIHGKPSSPLRTGSAGTNAQAQLPAASGQQQAGPRRDRERIGNERADPRDRDRLDRANDRDHERAATPPNRTGSATKSGGNPHHPYNRR